MISAYASTGRQIPQGGNSMSSQQPPPNIILTDNNGSGVLSGMIKMDQQRKKTPNVSQNQGYGQGGYAAMIAAQQ